MPKPPAVGSRRFKYQSIFELTDDVVDLVVAEVDDRAQQVPIKLTAIGKSLLGTERSLKVRINVRFVALDGSKTIWKLNVELKKQPSSRKNSSDQAR